MDHRVRPGLAFEPWQGARAGTVGIAGRSLLGQQLGCGDGQHQRTEHYEQGGKRCINSPCGAMARGGRPEADR